MKTALLARLRSVVLLPVLLALAGCELGTDPVSLQLEFEPAHQRLEDGSCDVRFVARAFGIGAAEWDRVVIRRSGNVVREYHGAETADFWGKRTISAGEQQVSEPFRASGTAAGVTVEVGFRITGPLRTRTLPVNCEA